MITVISKSRLSHKLQCLTAYMKHLEILLVSAEFDFVFVCEAVEKSWKLPINRDQVMSAASAYHTTETRVKQLRKEMLHLAEAIKVEESRKLLYLIRKVSEFLETRFWKWNFSWNRNQN